MQEEVTLAEWCPLVHWRPDQCRFSTREGLRGGAVGSSHDLLHAVWHLQLGGVSSLEDSHHQPSYKYHNNNYHTVYIIIEGKVSPGTDMLHRS